MKRRWLALPLCLSLASAGLAMEPGAALADAKDDARELVYKGDELFSGDRFEEALSAYRRAQELMDVPSTRVEVARTLYVMGRWGEALQVATSIDVAPGFDEPEAFRAARARAHQLVVGLKDRVPTLRIRAGEHVADGTEVVIRNGERRYVGHTGEEVAVDPGTYAVGILGAPPVTVTVSEKQHPEVKIESVADARAEAGHPRKLSPVVISAITVSAAGLLTGTIAGGVYLSKRSSLRDACASGGSCTSSDVASVNRVGWVSNVGLGFAVAGGAVALVTALVDRSHKHSEPTTGLALGPGFVGYHGQFE